MKPITFIICAAGKGERFRKFGLNQSKPKILLQGMSMLERAIQSLERKEGDQLIIIGQKEDQLGSHFGHLKNVLWLEIDAVTRGQLDTFLHARDLILHPDIVIYNCDTYFESASLRAIIDSGNYDGVIPCSREPGTCWSFCQVNSDGIATKVTEKDRISDWASVGYYYFKNKDRLIDLASQEVLSSHAETYVAPLYNKYIKLGLAVKMVPTEKFLPFGTFEQVQEYWGVSIEDLLDENR